MAFYNKDIKKIYSELESCETGLKLNEIQRQTEKYGQNILEKQKKNSFLAKFFAQFKNIMIIILLISAIISAVSAITQKEYENLFEGLLIFGIVIVNAFVGVIQEQKAENALSALAKSTEPFAIVIRDGKAQKIKVHEIVVGDIIELKSGNCVPADIRIISCKNFKCDESSLTGESHSVNKKDSIIPKNNVAISDQENMCFSGTTVTSGKAKGIVVAVGKNTELGKIAKILTTSLKEKTPLEKNIDKIGKVITFGVLGIVLIVFLVQVFLSKNISILQALLTAVALAVAAIPESLPAVITIIMALGVQKLARENAIIKKLSAVETLGCCNIICSDKTGTLTKNEMTAKHILADGKIFDCDNFDLDTAPNLVRIACLCNNISLDVNKKVVGDATETSIINYLYSKNIDFQSVKSNFKRINENEFSSNKKLMSVVCSSGEKKFLFVKGALDYLLPRCSKIYHKGEITPITQKYIDSIESANEAVCENGERVIGFAYKEITTSEDESELVFAGFIGIIDPPRSEVYDSVKLCKKAGLKTIMITGDHPTTAFSIAKKIGIASTKKQVLTGTEINKLSQKELEKIISNYSVFARVTPEHKLMIVKALKKNGNIVSMTGDGVNDAPSIKTANIGVCMGITGTDVTKEVADVIISDDNFATIVVAIKEGRTIYHNITKTIIFLLSTNIVEVLGIFVTSLVMKNAVFLLPAQILFINLVTDSLPAFALGIEPSEKNIMDIPPRNPNKSLLSGKVGTTIIFQGFVQTLMVLIMFVSANSVYGNEVASTMSFLTICLMQIIHAINCKSDSSIFKMNIFKNKFFNFSFLVLLALILAVYFVPYLASLFCLTRIPNICLIIVLLTSISIIPLVELGKLIIKD